ncbi:CDP-alcohol phosphatidyltransferase family protein [Pseudomonadales bacterium]|nr:CDP-alcohol phosphatidyltransferase family protein [Pseudomonadales bacterium]
MSASRFVLSAAMILTVSQQLWLLSGTVFLLAVASDLLDGALARRLDQVTKIGGLIDHAADATFVTITITCLALQQERSLLLPMLIILAFTQYVIDSRAHRGQRLIASRLGRYNGIGYFLFAGALLLDEVVTPSPIWGIALMLTYWALFTTTLLSIFDRALAQRQS